MESPEELQQQEITVLKSIYGDDFKESPPPKAWKGAVRLPEFIIKVSHPESEHAYFHLNTKFPKTYPTLAYPIFTIQKPTLGLNNEQIMRLSSTIHAEAQKQRGVEMVFQIITFAQEWMVDNVKPKTELSGSLATEMVRRANEAERERQMEIAAEAERQAHLAAQLAEQFQAESKAQLHKQRQQTVETQNKNRHRAWSDATEVPRDAAGGDMVVESFQNQIEFEGVSFTSVKIFHPKKDGLGVTYLADPICDDVRATLPLEVHIITFTSNYYMTTQGRKKLKQVEAEINRLSGIVHPNLLRVLAVKLSMPHTDGNNHDSGRLVVLSEERPRLSLEDVLEDSDSLREGKAKLYLSQCLSGLYAIHAADLVHRGLSLQCIGLANPVRDARAPQSPGAGAPPKIVKIGRIAYYTRLVDLNRSNSFGPSTENDVENSVPDAWLSKDVVESPLLYTKSRDIHCLGIILLQMLIGKDVMEQYPDGFQSVLGACLISPALQQYAKNMLLPTKKTHISCMGLLAELSEMSLHNEATPYGKFRSQSIAISGPKTPRASISQHYGSSPEKDYFRSPPPRTRHTSRWKEDWEELELLGKGAFGSVVKARNKIDSRIYAVKKVKLRTNQSDSRIFREVNTLSRLSHRFIVRYYTTWVETSEPISTAASSRSASDTETTNGSDSADGMTSVPHSMASGSARDSDISSFNGRFSIDLNDLDDTMGGSGHGAHSSFPSIHFGGSASSNEKGSDSSESSRNSGGDPFGNLFAKKPSMDHIEFVNDRPKTPLVARTLYIQMEFVEQQTLKERVDEGLSEEDSWRLFQQILDALVHMSSLGILHRDIKLTNIFIDAKGDCKVGDFGLATSSLQAVDPSDVSPILVTPDADMTLEVGTRLYIAPEVQARKKGPRNQTKADIYSLGIVFFEMNFPFSTGAERIAVIEDLRKPGVYFPPSWPTHLERQKKIITQLLQHDPSDRPTALELSQSPLLPPRIEDEYFKGALRMMTKHDSPHRQAVLTSLFSQPPSKVRGFLYDAEAELPEHAALNDIVQDRIASIFRLHGTVYMEPSLLMPVANFESEHSQAMFLDRQGEVVTLPNNALVPFARLAARSNITRIKRYHIADVYKPVAGHPKVFKAAVFDIISPDLENGPIASSAEVLALIHDCLCSFPGLSDTYEVHISHSKIVDLALNRIASELRPAVIEIINQTKSLPSQKRALLLKKGLLRSTADELEVLSEVDDDVDGLVSRLEKVSPTLVSLTSDAIEEIKKTILYATTAGFSSPIFFHPLMWGQHHAHFKDGVRIEVVRRTKRLDVLAAAGRYDALISSFAPPKTQGGHIPTCAIGMQINLDKITVALAAYQSASVKTLIKEEKSFGFWSPRRCDVYIVSYHPGYLQDRLEVAALLWQHNISADVMYESEFPEAVQENHLEHCCREGILFVVYPRPRHTRDQPAFKVKSILKGTEYDVSRQELVSHLQQQITEQKRVDLSTSGVSVHSDVFQSQNVTLNKDTPNRSDVQLLLPGDTKKQRKQVKQIFLDRAYEKGQQIKAAVQAGLPTLAVDVPTSLYDAMTKNNAWITDDEAWRTIINNFAPSHSAYAWQIRESVAKRKADGLTFLLLFAVREERVHLMNLT